MSMQAQKVNGEFLVNTVTRSGQSHSALAALGNGTFVAVWMDASGQYDTTPEPGKDASLTGIRAQIFDADGNKLGEEFLVNTSTSMSQSEPTVAALANGGFVVSWEDASGEGGDDHGGGIKAQMFDAGGAKVGGEGLINTTTHSYQIDPVVTVLAGGNLVFLWGDGSGTGGDNSSYAIKGQMFEPSGAPLGGEFLVNTVTFEMQMDPQITALAGGGFVAVWRDYSRQGSDTASYGVKAQVFSAGGAKVGPEFLVNTQTAGSQVGAVVAALSNGGFAVTWADASGFGGDSDSFGIKAQLFDAAGGRTGGEFLVNTTVSGMQNDPVIASLGDGRFAVAWRDESALGGDGSAGSIKMQVFANDGGRVGGELLVNSVTVNSQSMPAITGLGNGRVAVSWQDWSGEGGDADASGIKAQIFQLNDNPVVGSDALSATEDTSLSVSVASLLANDSDVFGDTFALTAVSEADGGTVVLDAKGTASTADDVIVFTPHANFSGQGGFSYTVTDKGGLSSKGTVGVAVAPVNDAPVAAVPLADRSVAEDKAVSFVLPAGSFLDADNGQLALSAKLASGAALPSWLVFTAETRTFAGVPPRDFTGSLAIKVTASDGALSASSTFMLGITPVNDAPRLAGAKGQLAHGTEDAAYVVSAASLLSGFTDADGDALSVVGLKASHGLVKALGGGVFTITPQADYAGPVTLTYGVSDGRTTTASAHVVNLVAVNDAPSLTGPAAVLRPGVEDKAYVVSAASLLAGFTDADGDALSIVNLLADHARVTVNPDRTVTLKPEADYDGAVTLRYGVTDGAATTAAKRSVAFSAANDAPVIAEVGRRGVVTLDENKKAVARFNAADKDGDTLGWSLAGKDAEFFTISGTGALAFKAAPDFEAPRDSGRNNVYDVTVRVSDGTSADSQALAVAVADLKGRTASGTAKADTLVGTREGDALSGKAGDDKLKGGAGDDRLTGGAGADDLWGGSGKDVFVFTKPSDSTVSADGRDTVFDFARGDRFDLKAIDASTKSKGDQSFFFIGTDKFSGHAGELRFETKKSDTYVHADTNGDGKADFSIHLDDAATMAKGDFLL